MKLTFFSTTVITAMVIGCCAVPAHAAWQYTKWGMTAAQVVKASKNKALPDTDVHGKPILSTPYSSGKFVFKAQFFFEGGNLSEVGLTLISGDPRELITTLQSKYGVPENETPGVISAWRWRTKTDIISAMMTGEKTMVFYRPSVDPSGKGL